MRMSKILVVDDDAELVDATKELLESRGYEVMTAADGEQGYRIAAAANPDLVLLDVMMTTDSEGFDIARRLRANPGTRETPVILVTGIKKAKRLPFSYEPDEDWLPVQAVLDKPVRPDDLLRSIEKALREAEKKRVAT